MTIISSLLFILSTVGVLGFACWDNDLEIPFFYSFGQLEAHWWFADKLKPGKPHLEQHDRDGPPLVARTATGGGPIQFPYPSGNLVPTSQMGNTNQGSFYNTWDSSLKMQGSFTPINGMYGVSNKKESDRTHSTEYYPNALDPADYIAARMLGPHADWTELETMGDRLKIYNTKTFKDGTPFKAAVIGGDKTNDPRWKDMKAYVAATGSSAFMPPLTSAGVGAVNDTYGGYASVRSENDYSGAEYPAYDQDFEGSLEQKNTHGYRPPHLYQERANGTVLSPNQNEIAAWAGEYPDNIGDVPPNGSYVIQNAYYDPNNGGGSTGNGQYFASHGWGTKGITTAAVGGYYPTQMQKDYIITQLSQENPITTIDPPATQGDPSF